MKRNKSNETGKDQAKRVAIYFRVSSQRQASEGDSLEAQQNATRRYLESQREIHGWTIDTVVEYREAGKSAKNMNRPALQRLMDDVRSGKINMVVAYKLDRISRNVRDFLNLWDFFEQYGVTLHLLRESFDTGSSYGRLFMVMTAAFAELERENISERTLMVMLDRTERGLHNGTPPLGYASTEKGKGKLEIVVEKAALVRHIFNLFEETGSAGGAVRELAWQGINYPVRTTRKGQLRGGKPFKKQQVIGILQNPVYIGWIKWRGKVKENCLRWTPNAGQKTGSAKL